MPNRCCIPRCNAHYKKGPLHLVPNKRFCAAARQEWATKLEKIIFSLRSDEFAKKLLEKESLRICERHFKESDFYYQGGVIKRRRLKVGALPTLKLYKAQVLSKVNQKNQQKEKASKKKKSEQRENLAKTKKLNADKKSLKERRGIYSSLEDIVDAFSVLGNTSGWILHQYKGWICFAIYSKLFEDPDIKVIIKHSLQYKIIVAGLLLDTRLPSLAKNEIKTVLSFAEKSLKNVCCGVNEVSDAVNCSVVHRRYSYDVFESPAELPRYETTYRSQFCAGRSQSGPCSFCNKLVKKETKDNVNDKNFGAENEFPSVLELRALMKEKSNLQTKSFIEDGLKLLSSKSFKVQTSI